MAHLEHLGKSSPEFVALLEREIAEGKRYPYVYTYPPKGAFRPWDDHAAVRESWRDYRGPLSMYVHVPFCDIKCSFCTLFTTIGQPPERIERYVNCLIDEFHLLSSGMAQDAVHLESLYFGGGTPSVLTVEQLGLIVKTIKGTFTFAPDMELSIESTPDAVDEQRITEIAALGVNRVSFGVQSFVESELANMGRHYPAELGRSAPRAALAAGVPNVNVDLIFGIPGQRLDGWLRNLDTAIELGVPTITLYPLVVRERTKYARLHRMSPDDFLDEKGRQQWYETSVERLARHGFTAHSEVTFARPGGGCRHEGNEFRGVPTLGLGSGARSYAPGLQYTDDNYRRKEPNQKVIDAYLAAIEAGRPAVYSAVRLDDDERRLRYAILALLHEGVRADTYRRMFGDDVEQDFGAWFAAVQAVGLGSWVDGAFRLTGAGRTHSAMLAAIMMSPAMRSLNEDYK
jgi:oxygen-independent coproporphyrinogen-3 oxidase